mmetsp:Transcript_95857/g.190010  ORF Transcript_95857/g.190010 Transcript_95857/m.190010 type:complete len:84 (+) Transcript_95857:170-421(+)
MAFGHAQKTEAWAHRSKSWTLFPSVDANADNVAKINNDTSSLVQLHAQPFSSQQLVGANFTVVHVGVSRHSLKKLTMRYQHNA